MNLNFGNIYLLNSYITIIVNKILVIIIYILILIILLILINANELISGNVLLYVIILTTVW